MAIFERIDPEIAPIVASMPDFDYSDLPKVREEYTAMWHAWGFEPDPRVISRDMTVPARGEHPPVRVKVFSPESAQVEPRPAILWIPGGGYLMEGPLLDHPICQHLVLEHNCVVVSVAWRLAPENPFPAATEDCYGALAWLAADMGGLGIDPTRLVLAGQSSGGGSAAGVALLVRERQEFAVAHQMLIYPMIDDRNDTPSSYQVTDDQVFNRERNAFAWRAYLGDREAGDPISPIAAPARMEDLRGSIPASILTGELDLFRDENIQYALRLMRDEVPTELHVYAAAPHGWDQINPDAEVSRRFIADRDAILRRVFAPQPE